MNKQSTTQQVIDEALSDSTSEDRLIELVSSRDSIVRCNAMVALSRRIPESERQVVSALHDAARSKSAKQVLIGTMSEAMCAAAALNQIGTPLALEQFALIRDSLSKVEQEDLAWNIRKNYMLPVKP